MPALGRFPSIHITEAPCWTNWSASGKSMPATVTFMPTYQCTTLDSACGCRALFRGHLTLRLSHGTSLASKQSREIACRCLPNISTSYCSYAHGMDHKRMEPMTRQQIVRCADSSCSSQSFTSHMHKLEPPSYTTLQRSTGPRAAHAPGQEDVLLLVLRA